MKQPGKNNLFILVSVAVCITANAQKFVAKANLEAVSKPGFYSIDITPKLSSYTTVNFSNLRVAGEGEHFVPYFVSGKQVNLTGPSSTSLPIIKNELKDSGRSLLIIENRGREQIKTIDLLIRNATVSRLASISGSDDMNQWFTVAENILLAKQFVTDTDKYVQSINFPTSSYRFFKITVDNGKNNPLNIMQATTYTSLQSRNLYSWYTNPLPVLFLTDSADHNSYIKVHQLAAYHINKVTLKISGSRYFKRDVDIIYGKGVSNFQISSDTAFNFYLPAFNDQDWLIKIYNGDNTPLKVESVVTAQEAQRIITYLGRGSYHLLADDRNARQPVYDLQQFKDSIPAEIKQLKIISLTALNVNNAGRKIPIPAKLLWPVIIAMIAILGFVTFRLTKEMNNRA